MAREELGKKSVTRNPLLAAMFLRADYIEKLGTGINRIQEAMIDAGLPKADFQMNYFFSASFPRVYAGSEKSSEKGSEKGSEKSPQEMSQETVEKTVEKIIHLIEENPKITIKELELMTGLTRRGVEWNIDKLKKQGVIKRVGPKVDIGKYWIMNNVFRE